jgi:hypothetical protein
MGRNINKFAKFNKLLKPCPKCGAKVEITTSRGEDYVNTDISCTNCDYYLNCVEDTWCAQPEQAIEEWNNHIE